MQKAWFRHAAHDSESLKDENYDIHRLLSLAVELLEHADKEAKP
jgi:hypothetical protein